MLLQSSKTDSFADLNTEAVEANVAWRKVLGYLQAHPEKAAPLLSTIKGMFYNDACTFKSTIDFKNLAEKYSMVFS